MLQGLAKQAMQGRWQATILIVAMSLIAIAILPVNYLASGLIALVTLRAGPKEGLLIIMMSTVLYALVVTVLLNQAVMTGVILISSWLPVYGMTLILGYTRSLMLSLLIAAGVGVAMVVLTFIVLPDPALWWQNMLSPLMSMLVAQPDWQMSEADTQQFVTMMSTIMTGLMVTGLFTNAVLGLLLGRAWQANLYNPGGFAEEFLQLRLGQVPALLTALLLVVSMVPNLELVLVQNVLLVLLALFALQGLAVVHAIVRYRKMHKAWLIIMYILLLITMPQMVFLLAIIGVLEQWFNFRRRSMERDN